MSDEDQSSESFFVAGAVFGEVDCRHYCAEDGNMYTLQLHANI